MVKQRGETEKRPEREQAKLRHQVRIKLTPDYIKAQISRAFQMMETKEGQGDEGIELLLKKYEEYASAKKVKSNRLIVEALQAQKSGKSLCLKGGEGAFKLARLQDDDIVPLFEALLELDKSKVRFPFLATVDLSFNNLGDEAAKAIARFVASSSQLRHLDVTANNIQRLGCEAFCECLKADTGCLESLSLNSNPIGDSGMVRIARVLRGNTSLKRLNVGNTHMGTQAVMEFALTFTSYNKTVQVLNLDAALLFSHQEDTTIYLAKMLGQNKSLTSLSLAKSRMGDHGAMWLAQYLAANRSLVHLNLRCNLIGGDGARHLGAVLAQEDCVVRTLDLEGNRLTDEGAAHLAEALRANCSLEFVNLRYTHLLDSGLADIAEALRLNRSLKLVLLEGNIFGPLSRRSWKALLHTEPSSERVCGLDIERLDFLHLLPALGE